MKFVNDTKLGWSRKHIPGQEAQWSTGISWQKTHDVQQGKILNVTVTFVYEVVKKICKRTRSVMLDKKLSISQQCALAARRAKSILYLQKQRELIIHQYSAFMRQHPEWYM